MFKFLKKLFVSVDRQIDASDKLDGPSVEYQKAPSHDEIIPNVENESLKGNSLDDALYLLRSYDGYRRQWCLEQLQDCYETALFPALLFRLSDYVPINQKLAAAHLQRWSERSEFSQLCIDYFLDIAATQKRLRVVTEIEDLLLREVAHNQAYLQNTLVSLQGALPRILLVYIQKYKWIEPDHLLELCRVANDQMVRKFWLDTIVQTQSNQNLLLELHTSKLRDVQYYLFDVLYQRAVLTTNDLIHLWHSRFLSIMDYAYFALRQSHFDFEKYFAQHSIENLNQQQLKIRVYQWVLMKGERSYIFKVIHKIESQKVANALVLFTLKQKQITLDQYFEYFQSTQKRLSAQQFVKAKAVSATQPSLDELRHYLCLSEGNLSFQQRLDLTQGYSLWDQLYWFVTQQKMIETENDQQNFDDHLHCRLQSLHYEIYPPRWTFAQKNEIKPLISAFMKQYPIIFEDVGVQKILGNL